MTMYKNGAHHIGELSLSTDTELLKIAQELNIENVEDMDRKTLVYKIIDQQALALNQTSLQSNALKSPKNTRSRTKTTQVTKQNKEKKTLNNKAKKKSSTSNQENGRSLQAKKEKVDNNKQDFTKLDGIIQGQGVLEIAPDGYGFLRSAYYNYQTSPDDIYVSHAQIKTWGLKIGDTIEGKLRFPSDREKYFGLIEPTMINGRKPEEVKNRIPFEDLTPLFPQEKLNIVSSPTKYTTRIIDLCAPIGKGQRGLIVAPPKAGKSSLMTDIAVGIAKNHPEVYLIVLLIDERVEEATHMKKNLEGIAEVVASTFDKKVESHIKLIEIVLEKAKRMVESGQDVVIMMDSLTRAGRAYNRAIRSSGKTLSGGIDINALNKPKQFFGAARNIENGGSLTMIATILINTGSKMDDYIYEELKSTGNADILLIRLLLNKGIFPPIDIINSKTRKEELLHSPEIMKKIRILRHAIANTTPEEAITLLLKNMHGTRNNEEFLASMHD